MAEPRSCKARRSIRWLALTVVPLLLVLSIQFGGVSPAHAAGGGDGCQPLGSNRQSDIITWRHEGYFMWDGGADDVFAVEANILWYSPWVDYHKGYHGNQDYKSDSTAWVMLQTTNAKTGWAANDYLQDGWLEYPYGDRHDFIEWTGPNGKINHWDFGPYAGINQYVTYRTEYNPADKKFRFYLGDWNANSARMTFPLNQVGFTPDIALVSGETHSSEDQLPGGTGFK